MKTKSTSRRDFTQVAFNIVQIATGEAEPTPELTGKKADSSKGGKIGGNVPHRYKLKSAVDAESLV